MKLYRLQSKLSKFFIFFLFLPFTFLCFHCGNGTGSQDGSGTNDGDDTLSFSGITFNAVGTALPSNDLINIEFLPGQNGESIVIGQAGGVYYLRNDFTALSQTASVTVEYDGEQGLLNVCADPDYASNHYVYFYYTVSGGGINRVSRATVSVDVSGNSFSLSDLQTIIDFDKSYSPSPGGNHNGGGLFFENSQNLFISVGDGGGSSSTDEGVAISQDGQTRLGKVLRIIPNRTASLGGYSIPSGNDAGANLPEIYALGLRNPFTITYANSTLYIGDVGANAYEEVDASNAAALNFGWPFTEGPTSDASYRSPLQYYAHSDDTFINDDTEAHSSESLNSIRSHHNGVDHGDSNKSVMVLHYYTGDQYNGFLSNRLIYSDFYLGWVRGVELNASNAVEDDDHLGHLVGLTSLQEGADGLLYGVSLYGSDHILRLDLSE